MDQKLNNIRELEKLKAESNEFFLKLFKKYFINAPIVVVKGKPSVEEYLRLREEEERITAQQILMLQANDLLHRNEACLQQAKNTQNVYIN